jgi:hypothetical protein
MTPEHYACPAKTISLSTVSFMTRGMPSPAAYGKSPGQSYCQNPHGKTDSGNGGSPWRRHSRSQQQEKSRQGPAGVQNAAQCQHERARSAGGEGTGAGFRQAPYKKGLLCRCAFLGLMQPCFQASACLQKRRPGDMRLRNQSSLKDHQ